MPRERRPERRRAGRRRDRARGAAGLWRDAWRRLRKNPGAIAGAALVLIFVICAIVRAVARAVQPTRPGPLRARPGGIPPGPSSEHWFGVDTLGRDEFSRILYGARLSLLVGVISVSVGLTIGAILGAMAGFFGGKLDSLIMRFVDIMLAIPGFLLAIGIVALLGPGLYNIMIAVGPNMPVFARLLRGSVLQQKENDFVLAARATGVPRHAILTAHILPNALSPLIVAATLALATAIIDVAGLKLPRPRRPESRAAGVGGDADGDEPVPPAGAVARDHPGARDRPVGTGLQPDRRRAPRGPRPEASWPT